MRRPRLVAVGALVTLGFVSAACSGSSLPHQVLTRHPEVGWVDGKPPPATGGSAPGPSTPNIIFVLTDDLSSNLVQYMPHVLAMQRDGVTFSNYFVTDSLCCPSRSSIFTGQFPHNSGVIANDGPHGGFDAFLAQGDGDRTFAVSLQQRGYATGLFGKFLNLYGPAVEYEGQRPYVPPGWSVWDVAGTSGYDEYDYVLTVGRHLGQYGDEPGDYLTNVLASKAGRFISTSVAAHKPFMAEIATFAPHGPFTPAPEDTDKFPGLGAPRGVAYGRAVVDAPTWLAAIPPMDATEEAYQDQVFRLKAQAIQSVDRLIGRLQNLVQRLGVAGNTYFVFNSDNGFHLGEHNLRPGKQTAFDTDIRVPLVVTGPGVPAGSTVTQLTQNIDLAPTFEDLGGATPQASTDGRSLVPFLHGDTVRHWRDAVLVEHSGPTTRPSDPDYSPTLSGNPPSYHAIRTPRYLYVEYADGEHEFYNLVKDPNELHNRFSAMPISLFTHLHDVLLRMSSCHGADECWKAQHTRP